MTLGGPLAVHNYKFNKNLQNNSTANQIFDYVKKFIYTKSKKKCCKIEKNSG